MGLAFVVEKLAAANPLVHYLLLGLALVYGLPAALAVVVVVLGIPAALISALSLVMTGAKVPFAGPYLDLAAEASPPGEWTVTNLECRRKNRGLIHSEIHGDAQLSGAVTSWIVARARVREASRGGDK